MGLTEFFAVAFTGDDLARLIIRFARSACGSYMLHG
jgi:hypothetical protein